MFFNKKRDRQASNEDLLRAVVQPDTGYDLDTGKPIKISVEPEEARADAEFIRNSKQFRQALQSLDDKYTGALKYNDPTTDPYYHTYSLKLQGVNELITELLKPLAIEE